MYYRVILIILSLICLSSCSFTDQKSAQNRSTHQGDTIGISQSGGTPLFNPMLSMNIPQVVDILAQVSSNVQSEPTFRQCLASSIPQCAIQAIDSLSAKPDNTLCNDLGRDLKEECIRIMTIATAKISKDVNDCNSLNPTYINECKRVVIMQRALDSKNINDCDLILSLDSPKPRVTNSGSMQMLSSTPVNFTSQLDTCKQAVKAKLRKENDIIYFPSIAKNIKDQK